MLDLETRLDLLQIGLATIKSSIEELDQKLEEASEWLTFSN